MIRLLGAAAATLLALSAFIQNASACDEDCYYERQEAAYERAYEREEAAEEGYYSRQGSGSSRRRTARRAVPRQRAPEPVVAEPKPSSPAQSQPRTVRTKVANESSSIATGSSEVASDDLYEDARPRKASRATGCKSYFPSVGMTLSVPCG